MSENETRGASPSRKPSVSADQLRRIDRKHTITVRPEIDKWIYEIFLPSNPRFENNYSAARDALARIVMEAHGY